MTLVSNLFDRVWELRPRDISVTEDGITPQAAIYRLRSESGMSIAQFAAALGVAPSKIAYAEAKGKLTLAQWSIAADLAGEFAMPLLAHRLNSIRAKFQSPPRGRPQKA